MYKPLVGKREMTGDKAKGNLLKTGELAMTGGLGGMGKDISKIRNE